MHSLVIEAHSVPGAIRFFTFVELVIQGNNKPSTVTQIEIRFQLQCELHGALRFLSLNAKNVLGRVRSEG